MCISIEIILMSLFDTGILMTFPVWWMAIVQFIARWLTFDSSRFLFGVHFTLRFPSLYSFFLLFRSINKFRLTDHICLIIMLFLSFSVCPQMHAGTVVSSSTVWAMRGSCVHATNMWTEQRQFPCNWKCHFRYWHVNLLHLCLCVCVRSCSSVLNTDTQFDGSDFFFARLHFYSYLQIGIQSSVEHIEKRKIEQTKPEIVFDNCDADCTQFTEIK